MDKEELLAHFEQNVEYLRRNIPPDDIYLFCEQTYMAARYFLMKWSEHTKISDEMEKDKTTSVWVRNIISLQVMREKNIDVQLDLDVMRENE
jgi:hypothetical protein